MKGKSEEWYLTNLPTVKELQESIKAYKKSLAEYTALSRRSDIPSPIRENYKEFKIPQLEEKIAYYQLAIDMSVKGYILGQQAARKPPAGATPAEERLLEAIFGKPKEEEKKEDKEDEE